MACRENEIRSHARRGDVGEKDADDPPLRDPLGHAPVLDVGDDVRTRGQPIGHSVREARESVPRRPASNPLPGLLNREDRGADGAPVAWHEFHRARTSLGGQPEIDDRANDVR